jgi:hypothetical protein
MRTSLLAGAVLLFGVSAFPASAQTGHNSTSTYDLDTQSINGGPMPGLSTSFSETPGSTRTIETRQSLNGHSVPAEKVNERVVSNEGGVKVVERTIERYDPNGEALPPEKQVITTAKHADGSEDQQNSIWRADLNGNMALAEKDETAIRHSGGTVTSETSVERPSLNDSLSVVEKRDVVRTEGAAGAYEQNETVWRNDPSGGFYEAVRRVTEHKDQASGSSDNTAEYEVGNTGALELHSQMVRNTVKAPDGSQTTEVTYLDKSAPGTVESGDNLALKLRSQEIVETSKGPGGAVRETISVRRPTISDPNTLGPATKVSETVCHGDCSADRP